MKVQIVPLVLVGALVAFAATLAAVNLRRQRRRRFITTFESPAYLKSRLREVRPGLTPDQETLVFDGLRQHCHACRLANGRFVSRRQRGLNGAARLSGRQDLPSARPDR